MKRWWLMLALLCAAAPAAAQTTAVTAHVTDASGIPYSNATVSAVLVPSGQAPTINGAQVSGTAFGQFDVNGNLSMSLFDNSLISPGGTQWQITVNESPGVAQPLGTGSQTFTITVTISGASQSLTTQMNAVAPALTHISVAGGVTSVVGTAPISATPTTGAVVVACSPQCLTTSTGANAALSNLAAVAINTSLLAGADNSIDLGSGAKQWRTGRYGTSLFSPIYSSLAANPATTGVGRFGNNEFQCWRDSTNTVNGCWGLSNADLFEAGSISIHTSGQMGAGSFAGPIYRTDSAIVASSGKFRLGNTDTINWRNAGNSADLGIQVNAANVFQLDAPVNTPAYQTLTNCADSAGPAACGAAAAGSFVMDAGNTSVVVSTTAVTGNSEIFVQYDSSLGTRLGVTCNTTVALPAVTARTPGVSFTVTVPVGPAVNPACYDFFLVN